MKYREIKEKAKRFGLALMCSAILMTGGVFSGYSFAGDILDVHAATDTDSTDTDSTDTDSTDTDKTTTDKTTTDKSTTDDKDDEITISSTSEFLIVGDNAPTVTGKYGQPVHLILPIFNLGLEMVTNVVVTPIVSTKIEDWPFALNTTGLVQVVDNIPASPNKEIAYLNRREVEWDLTVRKDAMTGYYPLNFNITYYRNGGIESATLTMYVYIEGAPGSGSVEGSDSDKASNPRIIVTGFTTEPAEIFAGDKFKLTIDLQNTSKTTAVSNIMFDLEAAQEGIDDHATYSAFLPTSGSSTIFKDSIAEGANATIEIELVAKADLTQKPYVLDIKMDYEDSGRNTYSTTSNVSIPIKQVAKFDVSSVDVMPNSISVGNESNIMFSIYNTGKTILYNTKVVFEADSISGGDTFIGKIEPGATGNVDAMVAGEAMTMDEGLVKIIISYEDESGNVTTVEKECNLVVTEDMGMDEGYFEGMEMMDGMEQTSSAGKIIKIVVIIVVIVVVVVVGLFVFLRMKKKKKDAQLLEDDLSDIDDDIDL